jgi:preprotein translocase subunit SecG
MGVRKTTDFLEKATWGLAGTLLFLSIVAVGFIPRGERPGQESQFKDLFVQTQDPNQVPNFPAPAQEQAPAPATAAPDTTN